MTIKQFSQTDPQWKATLLGFDRSSTIGGYGCLLTSMTMCATHYGASDLTPASMNDKMKTVGGFQGGTAFMIPGAVGAIVPGMRMDYRNCGGSPAPLAEIDNHLAMNLPVIVEVDYSPAPGVQTHYMVAYGKTDSDYLIYDPYPYPTSNGQIILGQSKYAQIAGSKDPAQIITGVFFTSGPIGPLVPPPPPNLDTGVHASFPVYALADGLALRSQMVVADYSLINRYALNTQFTVLEADATANAQVGQNNTWLPVKAPDGTQGYVAAWLVSKTVAAAPAATAAPVSVPVPVNAVVVKTTVDGLKLRSRPDNTDATILKVLPMGTELKCLDPASSVQQLVGVMAEWLNVVDLLGTEGVVAAWYVTLSTAGTFGPQPQTQTGAAGSTVAENQPLILRTLDDQVALRAEGVILSNNYICSLPRGTELIVLDPPAVALPLIGQTNQWIHVRDVKGNQGYIEAWVVGKAPPAPAAQAGPQDS